MSRPARDIFIFAVKVFIAKRELKTAVILNKIERLDLSENGVFDYVMEIESLKLDMARMFDH